MESKLYKFKVEGFDPVDKIGEGEHTRAIILCELEGVVPVDCASSHSCRHVIIFVPFLGFFGIDFLARNESFSPLQDRRDTASLGCEARWRAALFYFSINQRLEADPSGNHQASSGPGERRNRP